ncbi:hypothetical protein [Treponema sp.]|uniref:hypothetical protein n=1 Tax=Treponema sp. TaxID=166 RepID=UPI00298E4BA7|nr:hypothetical protein [Treponema sp.]
MALSKNFGKTIVLLILIIILAFGGLLWFDFLGLIHVKKMFSPVYKLFGMQPQTSVTSTSTKPLFADLDQDRLTSSANHLRFSNRNLKKEKKIL